MKFKLGTFFMYLGAIPFTFLAMLKPYFVAQVGIEVFRLLIAITALFFAIGLDCIMASSADRRRSDK